MTSPHASRRPPDRREGNGREPPGAGGRVVHHVSDAPRRANAPREGENGPSIVISPHAEEPPPSSRSLRKRTAEPTLVIRDKRRVQEMRDGVRRIARQKARQRLGSILLWGGASALAFGFGTAVAFFAATAGKASPQSADDVPPAAPVQGAGVQNAGVQGAADSPAVRPANPEPTDATPGASEREPSGAVSLSDLPEAAASPKRDAEPAREDQGATSTSTPRVISLEDL